MSKIKDLNNNYEGYIWMSDQTFPIVIEGDSLIEYSQYFDTSKENNPFIVEAQLYCREENVSYSIRHTGGELQIVRFDLNDYRGEEQDDVSYLSHRMDGRWLRFRRVWLPEKDENCCGMEVLKLSRMIFVGFNSKEERYERK